MSPGVEQCINSWKYHLGKKWTITVVDDEKLKTLVPSAYLPQHYDRLDPKKKSDSARLALIRTYGGVWADAHILMLESYKWLERLFSRDGATFVGYANTQYSNDKENGTDLIESWWFAALAESPVITAWNNNWVRGLNDTPSLPDFTNTAMFRSTHFGDISEGTKNYLFVAVALRHARDVDPGTMAEFENNRARVFLSKDGPSWHWDDKNHTQEKFDTLKDPRFFKFVSIQHNHADQAAGDRDAMSSPFYRQRFNENAPAPARYSWPRCFIISALVIASVITLVSAIRYKAYGVSIMSCVLVVLIALVLNSRKLRVYQRGWPLIPSPQTRKSCQ